MTFRHVLVSLAFTCLCACSSDDTIVSLNVEASDRVPLVDRMQVTIKQGSNTHTYNFDPPTETSDEVESIKNDFFHRITLPGDWSETEAVVTVQAFQAGGEPFSPPLGDETSVTIRPEGVAAAYVELDIPEEPPMMGDGGQGGQGGQGGTPGEGGGPAEGGAGAGGGGAPGEGGSANVGGGGAPGEGGTPSAGGASAGAGGS